MDHKPGKFHWYIRPKDVADANLCKCEAGTSCKEEEKTNGMDVADFRFCGGTVSTKSLSNMIIIAVIQEVTCAFILATQQKNWWDDGHMIALVLCRVVQFFPCFAALLGNHRNQSSLILPFVFSQVLLGSYADIQSYILLLSSWSHVLPSSPLIYLVIPLLLYAVLLSLLVYVQYKTIIFVNMKSASSARQVADDTVIESLM